MVMIINIILFELLRSDYQRFGSTWTPTACFWRTGNFLWECIVS